MFPKQNGSLVRKLMKVVENNQKLFNLKIPDYLILKNVFLVYSLLCKKVCSQKPRSLHTGVVSRGPSVHVFFHALANANFFSNENIV